MKAIYLFLTVNLSQEEFVVPRGMRANVLKNLKVRGQMSKFAMLEDFCIDGVEYSLSAN